MEAHLGKRSEGGEGTASGALAGSGGGEAGGAGRERTGEGASTGPLGSEGQGEENPARFGKAGSSSRFEKRCGRRSVAEARSLAGS